MLTKDPILVGRCNFEYSIRAEQDSLFAVSGGWFDIKESLPRRQQSEVTPGAEVPSKPILLLPVDSGSSLAIVLSQALFAKYSYFRIGLKTSSIRVECAVRKC